MSNSKNLSIIFTRLQQPVTQNIYFDSINFLYENLAFPYDIYLWNDDIYLGYENKFICVPQALHDNYNKFWNLYNPSTAPLREEFVSIMNGLSNFFVSRELAAFWTWDYFKLYYNRTQPFQEARKFLFNILLDHFDPHIILLQYPSEVKFSLHKFGETRSYIFDSNVVNTPEEVTQTLLKISSVTEWENQI